MRPPADIDLSIVIVNYNVRHFLEQCLRSVFKSLEGVKAEVFVVDNNSVDGSQRMLREKFGDRVILIENRENVGFSRANNQAMRQARGRYVLLLNPDTLVEEQTFRKCLDFMDAHPEAGALGVHMVDGQGQFLPESKRALPTPWVSFYKVFGLARLFPRNKRFGRYHLTYLDKNETHEVEILSGAFMWLRKEVLDKIGLLDETFFMYGEDIDLSYRVIQAGYKNYYFAGTQIIHYKGESTKKGSLNYVRVFYQAMIIFARKHFGGSRKAVFIGVIRAAVYLRALMAIIRRLFDRLWLPALEYGLIYLVMFGIMRYWEHYVKYIEGGAYPEEFVRGYMPVYSLVFVFFLWIMGAYRRPYRLRPLILGPVAGFIAIATVTFTFDAVQNFSRAIVGLSAVFTMVVAMATRGLINVRERGSFFFTEPSQKRILLAGNPKGLHRLVNLLGTLDYPVDLVGGVTPGGKGIDKNKGIDWLGNLAQLDEVVRYYGIDEIIFCNESISTKRILELMTRLQRPQVEYKLVPPDADYIVGPQVILTSRYNRQILYNLQKPGAMARKQVFDVLSSAVLLLTFPLAFWAYARPGKAFLRLWRVFTLRSHMVGYIRPEPELPRLKPGLLNMLHRSGRGVDSGSGVNIEGLDRFYARSYNLDLDLEILIKGWRRIAS